MKKGLNLSKLNQAIAGTIREQNGVIFAHPALVGRETYAGRDILAQNHTFSPEFQDERGYLTVERWIMSATAAENDLPRVNEGVSLLQLSDGGTTSLTEAIRECRELLFGSYWGQWPLVKLLDIGGTPLAPSFGGPPETPPIPFHVHSGYIKEGKAVPPGKLEAYFFPPVDIPPYCQNWGRVYTRLGLRPETKKEEVIAALEEFGDGDRLYRLGRVYEIRPNEGWTIYPGCLHAPGPWPTFEVQMPQDDYNLAAWRFGERPDPAEREKVRDSLQLRGLADAADFLNQVVDWELSVDPHFQKKYHHTAVELESGAWGRRLQIFFDRFYGEALEINSGCAYPCPADDRPWAGLVWSGTGAVGAAPLRDDLHAPGNEFLVVPGHAVKLRNDGLAKLVVYRFFPFR
jgi:hypothetical protein